MTKILPNSAVMSSTDGINPAPKVRAELGEKSVSAREGKKLPKSAEEYVMIENRLAAQRQKPTEGGQFTSIFDQLRNQLGK